MNHRPQRSAEIALVWLLSEIRAHAGLSPTFPLADLPQAIADLRRQALANAPQREESPP